MGEATVLLGMPERRPTPRDVYWLPREAYDPAGRDPKKGRPVLVLQVVAARRAARVVTRTSSAHAQGPDAVSHAADAALRLNRGGWRVVEGAGPAACAVRLVPGPRVDASGPR